MDAKKRAEELARKIVTPERIPKEYRSDWPKLIELIQSAIEEAKREERERCVDIFENCVRDAFTHERPRWCNQIVNAIRESEAGE